MKRERPYFIRFEPQQAPSFAACHVEASGLWLLQPSAIVAFAYWFCHSLVPDTNNEDAPLPSWALL